MSRKRRQAAMARVRELREAAEVIEAMEEAAEAAVAERGFEMTSRTDDAVTSPTLLGSNDEALVWHPHLGMCNVWQARCFDKAKINDAVYPDTAPSDASCAEPGERDDKALSIARALVERDTEVEEPDEDEQRALAQIVQILAHLDERLTALESARAERAALDAEVEQLKNHPSLH
jgi:hypothetical protein